MSLGEQFASVLSAARDGAEWALASLYRDLHPSILRYLKAQEPSEAEDIASEVWLGVADGLRNFEGDEMGFRRWIFTIARRRLVDHRRAKARRRTYPVPDEELAGHLDPADVESEALSTISTDSALPLIATLPPEQAEVVLLRVIGGLSAEDVAAVTGKRPGTIRVIQHRALRRLARQLDGRSVPAVSRMRSS